MPNVAFRGGTQEKVIFLFFFLFLLPYIIVINRLYTIFYFSSINRDQTEWNQISNNVKPGGNFVVLDLDPASWYNVRITAHNSAGFTVAEYEFATLTVTGGKSSLHYIP